jgi:hypothetical protein
LVLIIKDPKIFQFLFEKEILLYRLTFKLALAFGLRGFVQFQFREHAPSKEMIQFLFLKLEAVLTLHEMQVERYDGATGNGDTIVKIEEPVFKTPFLGVLARQE